MMRCVSTRASSGNGESVQFDVDEASFVSAASSRASTCSALSASSLPKREQAVLYVKGASSTTRILKAVRHGNHTRPTNKLTLWKDHRGLPGGSETESKEKFDDADSAKRLPAISRCHYHRPHGPGPGGMERRRAERRWAANNILEVKPDAEFLKGRGLDDPDDPSGIPPKSRTVRMRRKRS